MKKVQKIIAIILALIVMASVYPAADFSQGNGVEAATPITGALVVTTARRYIGPKAYISGGLDLNVGVDCSGFVCAIYKLLGVDFVSKGVRSSYDMRDNYSKIGGVKLTTTNYKYVRNGDLVITNGGNHVGIGTDNGTMINQTNSTKNRIEETPLSSVGIVAIIRIDYTKWGGTNAANAPINGAIDIQPNDTNNTTAANNPGNPLAIPTATVTSSNRDAVKWIQTALNKVNGAGLDVDGALGPITESAIKSFQTKYGLSATGIADVTTINKIVEVYKLSASITAVSINQQGLTLEEGKTVQLTATVTPASSQSVKLSWSSSNKNNASVSSTGLVTAVDGCETGNVTITVTTPNGKTASTVVKVIGKPRKNEWFKGKWYSADGKQTYKPTGSWKLGSGGWWYGDTSGWWAYSQWQKIDDKWYYFNANGYIYTGWHQINGVWYYFKSSGEMAENEWCNGYWLSKGGAWSYQSTGKWKHNSTGWWYEDTNGWYAKNESIKINGVKYTFNKDGYWDGKY